MEGQGHRDRYGNLIRQSSQGYSQGYSNAASQGFQGGYNQSRTQAQMGVQAPSYGAGQTSAQRPGSQGFAYNQSLPQYQSLPGQLTQYGGDFGSDPNRQSYSQMPLGYYNQPQGGYDTMTSYQRNQPQIQTQAFPDYYPESSYTAAPQTPSHIQQYPQTAYGQRQARTSNPSPYTPMSTEYPSFGQGQMQPPSMPQQQPESTRPTDGYRIYYRKLRETYDHIQMGRLAQGGPSLLEASDALLSRVEELGSLNATLDGECANLARSEQR